MGAVPSSLYKDHRYPVGIISHCAVRSRPAANLQI
jgi:hypothetical protein